MKQDKVLQVCYEDQTVGTLAMTADHKVAFQYSDEWLETGFSINPFSLPLQKQVFVPVKDHFEGLFGVFADSLPDHWGRLLLGLAPPLVPPSRYNSSSLSEYSVFSIF